MSDLLTVAEVSRQTAISRTSIYRWLNTGRLDRYVVLERGQRRLRPEAIAYLVGNMPLRADSSLERQGCYSAAPIDPSKPFIPDGWAPDGWAI